MTIKRSAIPPKHRTFESFHTRVQTLSMQAKEIESDPAEKKPGNRKIGAFTQAVLEIAPQHMGTRGYKHSVIAGLLANHPKVARLSEEARIKRVSNAVRILTRQNKLPAITVGKPLREATAEEMSRQLTLVEDTLRTGHRKLPTARRWREFLTHPEAQSIGADGLRKAIETWDEARGVPFGAHARLRIAGEIANAIARKIKERKATSRTEHLDTVTERGHAKDDDGESEEEEASEKTASRIRKIFQMHKSGIIDAREAEIFALRNALGHKNGTIAKVLGQSAASTAQMHKKTRIKLIQAIR